jgi:hypothetical protein
VLSSDYEWRLARVQALAAGLNVGHWSWLTGHGLGWGVDQQSGAQAVTSGLLGGDFSSAFFLGGILGLFTLVILWIGVTRGVRGRLLPSRPVGPTYFVVIVLGMSTVTPLLMLFVLGSGVPVILLFGFPIVWEAAVVQHVAAMHEPRLVKPARGSLATVLH